MRHATILAIDEALASSITIPLEMLHAADVITRIRNRRAERRSFVVASHDGAPVTMSGGIGIQPSTSIADITRTDLIFVPALWGNPNAIVRRHPSITAWLAAQHAQGATICSVGTGSFFLAEAGLLDARNMATSLALLPLVPVGVWVGVRLAKRISAVHFYRILSVGMFLTGSKLLWDAFR